MGRLGSSTAARLPRVALPDYQPPRRGGRRLHGVFRGCHVGGHSERDARATGAGRNQTCWMAGRDVAGSVAVVSSPLGSSVGVDDIDSSKP
jgi:hypothetical protein